MRWGNMCGMGCGAQSCRLVARCLWNSKPGKGPGQLRAAPKPPVDLQWLPEAALA